MTGLGSRNAFVAAVVWVAVCLPPLAMGQVQLRVLIEGKNGIQVGGNAAVVMAGGPFAGAIPAGGDPWWTAGAAAAAPPDAAPPDAAQMRAIQPAQLRLVQARRARAETLLVRELSRVREACPELEPAHRATVLAVGRAMVEEQAAGRSPLTSGLETALERALEAVAGAEVAVVYAEEVASRVARRKAAAIAVLVEVVDRDALLADDQRQALAAMLGQRWRPEWESVASTSLRQRITFARLPSGVPDAVAAALDPDTVAAWRARGVEATP